MVCLAQVYGVGGGDLRRMPDFRGASRAEMQGWPAVDGLLSASVGSAEPAPVSYTHLTLPTIYSV